MARSSSSQARIGLRSRGVLQLGVGQSTPQFEGGAELGEESVQLLGFGCACRAELLVCVADHRLEASGIQCVVGQHQRIPRLLGDQHLRGRTGRSLWFERAAQPGDVPLQRGRHRRRRRLTPEQVDDRIGRNGPSAVHRERSE